MASFASLPVELFEPIMADISRADMSRLSRTCKALHSTLMPVLFRKVTITWDYESQVGPPIVGLIQMLLGNPSVASHVQELELETRGYYEAFIDGKHEKDRDYYILPENDRDLQFPKDGLLPFHLHALRDEERALLQQALETCGTIRSAHWKNYNMEKADLDIAIAVLLSLCSIKIESLTVDVLVLLHSDCLSAFLRDTSPKFSRLTHVSVVYGAMNNPLNDLEPEFFPHNRYDRLLPLDYLALENFPRHAHMLPLQFPALQTLELALFPDLSFRRAITGYRPGWGGPYETSRPWPHPPSSVAANLITLRFMPTLASSKTIQYFLQHTPNLTTLEIDFLYPGSKLWFDCDVLGKALHPLRRTLKHLSIRFEVLGEDPDPENRAPVFWGSLGSLRDFEVLTTLDTSFAMLYGEVKRVNKPLLKDLLPPHLESLSIRDDLFDFRNAFIFGFGGPPTLKVLRKFFTGERSDREHSYESEEEDEDEDWASDEEDEDDDEDWASDEEDEDDDEDWASDEEDEDEDWASTEEDDDDLQWVEDGPPGWKTATPELREVTLDIRAHGYFSSDQLIALQQAAKEQKINFCFASLNEDALEVFHHSTKTCKCSLEVESRQSQRVKTYRSRTLSD